jgi:hypothetical protein
MIPATVDPSSYKLAFQYWTIKNIVEESYTYRDEMLKGSLLKVRYTLIQEYLRHSDRLCFTTEQNKVLL